MTVIPGVLSFLLHRLFRFTRLTLPFVPGALIAVAGVRQQEAAAVYLAWGGLGLTALALLLLIVQRGWARSAGITILAVHLLGLAWIWHVVPMAVADWYLNFVKGVLAAVPAAQAAGYALAQTGVLLMRRARVLAQMFRVRRNWPEDLILIRELSEVKVFREALQFDAAPALALLREKKPQVRMAALAALEFRKSWRIGQPEIVLSVLRQEAVPEVRAAAVYALANIDDRRLVEAVADSLRDPDFVVRRAAATALLWDADRRWNWIRYGVRRALGEPSLAGDGPIIADNQRLPDDAVNDLTAWAAEKGILGLRATQTLGVHYARSLQEHPETMIPLLSRMVQDPHTPALLRIEIAQTLCKTKDLDIKTLENLLDTSNPAPLRLLAAEALLDAGPHIRAIGSLREIAKLPNRELSLSTADVVQRRLGVDLGLAIGQPLPPLNSSRATDITRRLMAWAASDEFAENALDNTFNTTSCRRSNP